MMRVIQNGGALYVQDEPDGAVVASVNIPEDVRGTDTAGKGDVYVKIVDAPTDVPLPSTGLVVPPRVVAPIWGEEAERVDETGLGESVKPRPLLGKEARHLLVFLWPGDVERRMGCVDVPHTTTCRPASMSVFTAERKSS